MACFGGVEAGGTKFVCAVGDENGKLLERLEFPTTSPRETLGQVAEFFCSQRRAHDLRAIGIGSFGPLDLNSRSLTFGYITATPKPGWRNVEFVGAIQRATELPVRLDTDVNAAALAEGRWGAAQGLETYLYLTVGTGLGGGAVVNGRLLHGLLHPEMGHIRIPREQADPFAGACPFHRDCLEGLASGPALEQRWGKPGENLPAEHPAWELEARYLAYGLVSFISILAPERILMGGGIMQRTTLFPLIRRQVQEILNGYIQAPQVSSDIDTYIIPPALGRNAGVLGAIALAQAQCM